VKDKVLTHLAKYPEKDDYLASPGNTAPGIAVEAGVSRAHADVVLNKLHFEGRVRKRLGRVPDRRARTQVWFLNDKTGQPPNKTCTQLEEILWEVEQVQRHIREMIGGNNVRQDR
jgi:hypothetical protein